MLGFGAHCTPVWISASGPDAAKASGRCAYTRPRGWPLRPLAAIRTVRVRALRFNPPVAAPAEERVEIPVHFDRLAAAITDLLPQLVTCRARRL